jgi:hypothetical protein
MKGTGSGIRTTQGLCNLLTIRARRLLRCLEVKQLRLTQLAGTPACAATALMRSCAADEDTSTEPPEHTRLAAASAPPGSNGSGTLSWR